MFKLTFSNLILAPKKQVGDQHRPAMENISINLGYPKARHTQKVVVEVHLHKAEDGKGAKRPSDLHQNMLVLLNW